MTRQKEFPKMIEPQLEFPLKATKVSHLDNQDYVEGLQFENDTIDFPLANLEINGCTFSHVTFASSMERVDLLDVVFDHCDLSNLDFSNRSIHRVIFRDCKLVGTIFIEASLEHVRFENCTLTYSNFTSSFLRNVMFCNTNMDEVSFNEVTWKYLTFDHCTFAQTEFLHTSLKQLDFTSSDISGILLDPSSVRGMIVTSYQAITLSRLLGIVIQDEFS